MTKSSGCIPGFEHHPHRDSASVASGIPPSLLCTGPPGDIAASTPFRPLPPLLRFCPKNSLTLRHCADALRSAQLFFPPLALVIPHLSAEGCRTCLVIPHLSAEGCCTCGGFIWACLADKKADSVRGGLHGGVIALAQEEWGRAAHKMEKVCRKGADLLHPNNRRAQCR